jgi:hypothetical protein
MCQGWPIQVPRVSIQVPVGATSTPNDITSFLGQAAPRLASVHRRCRHLCSNCIPLFEQVRAATSSRAQTTPPHLPEI